MFCLETELKETKETMTALDEAWDTFGDVQHISFQESWSNGIAQEADLAWEEFCGSSNDNDCQGSSSDVKIKTNKLKLVAPECSSIYVSTKTKIAYLNNEIPLEDMFWAIPVLKSYACQQEGIVKKEMKFKTITEEGLTRLLDKVNAIEDGPMIQQNVKNHVEGGGSNVKFKDIRKISVGLCKKQMTSFRSKAKGAFFNCFAVILRMKWRDTFREMHVKVFNTGKLEIPGIPGTNTEEFLNCVLNTLVKFIGPLSKQLGLKKPLNYIPQSSETVLTNSNFSANYLIDREKLCAILRKKYRILSTYDPCSYPGVQSKFYHVSDRKEQTGRPVTDEETSDDCKVIAVPFMVFRTGSVLIVGKFDDDVLTIVYNFTKKLLTDEFPIIQVGFPLKNEDIVIRKVKKRFITIGQA